MTTGEAAQRRGRRMLVAWSGAVAIAAGGVLIGVGEWQAAHVGFGWFAYAPLSGTTFAPSRNFDVVKLGLLLVIVGVAAVAFAAGRRAATGGGGAGGSARLLRPVLVIGGAVAVATGAALEVWTSTRVVLGWHDFGPRSPLGDIVATRSQFEAFAADYWYGPTVVGVALLIVGAAALSYVIGREGGRRRRS